LYPERAKNSEVAFDREPAGIANFILSNFFHLIF
jgi:hypothetical protein